MKLTPLPAPPTWSRAFRFNRMTPARVRKKKTRINAEKVDRYMAALWTLNKEIKEMTQSLDDKPSTADSSNNEG